MTTAKPTTKGQITIPAAVRTSLGVQAEDRLEFIQLALGRYEMVAATLPVTALKGIVLKPGKAMRIEQMNAVLRERAAEAIKP